MGAARALTAGSRYLSDENFWVKYRREPMRARILSIIAVSFLLFAALGSADEPASEEEGAASGMAEEVLITLRVPLFSPLFASTPLASVEDEPIALKELTRAISSSHEGRADVPTSARKDYANLLDRLLTTKLIVQEARNIGLDELPEVAAQLDGFAKQLLIRNLMSRELQSVEADPVEVDRLYSRMVREFLLTTVLFGSPCASSRKGRRGASSALSST
jgi:hypothetical protein